MKKFFSSLLVTILTGLLAYSPITFASTPDGETPAQESVCNDLKTDGVTKGLYGLCVAFCEAHDFADQQELMNEDDLQTFEDEAPSGRILRNYNKKKSATDPAMPCIRVETTCPCWNTEEIDSIDGLLADNTGEGFKRCTGNIDSVVTLSERTTTPVNPNSPIAQLAQALASKGPEDPNQNSKCLYRNIENNAYSAFSTNNGTLTHAQAQV